MAFGAKEGCAVAEGDGGGVLNIVHAVTVNTGRHIRIVFLGQCIAMYACFVCVVNAAVAFGACFRNFQARRRCEFAACFAGQACLCVRVVTVHADGGILVACIKCDLVDAVMSLGVLFFVTILAGI